MSFNSSIRLAGGHVVKFLPITLSHRIYFCGAIIYVAHLKRGANATTVEVHFFNASASDRPTQYKYNDNVIYFFIFCVHKVRLDYLPSFRSPSEIQNDKPWTILFAMELHWNGFDNIVTSAFGTPKIDGDLTDGTLNEHLKIAIRFAMFRALP